MSGDLNPYQSPTTVDLVDDSATRWLSGELRRVRSGLYVIYYGIIAMLLAVIALPLLGILMAFFGLGVGGFLVPILFTLVFFGGSIAIFVGQVLCISVPQESGAKSLVTWAVGMQILGFVATFGWTLLGVAGVSVGGTDLSSWAGVISQMFAPCAGIVSFVLFVVFLKRLNQFIKNESLARSAVTVLQLMTAAIVFYFLMAMVMFLPAVAGAQTDMTVIVALCALALLVISLVTFLKYANLVLYSAKAIGRLPFADAAFGESPSMT